MDVGIGIVLRRIPDKILTIRSSKAKELQVLITRRKTDTVYPGYWEFPGGKMDPGEEIAACVARELREEAGIETEMFGVLSDVVHTYPHATVRLHPRLCRLTPDSPEPRNLHVSAHRWVRPEELATFKFPEANEAIVSELLDAINRGLNP